MKHTRALLASSIASTGILLVGCLSAPPAQNEKVTPQPGNSPSTTTASPTAAASSAAGKERKPVGSVPGQYVTVAPKADRGQLKDGSYEGSGEHKYGVVTVKATVAGGKISDVSATSTAQDEVSPKIDKIAMPMLKDQIIAAQSEKIAGVSGATYTSNAYATGLQQILDKAAA